MASDPVDLKKLPISIQCVIALSVTAIVVFAAWVIGKDQPISSWLTTKIITVLGWVYISLFASVMIGRCVGKKSN